MHNEPSIYNIEGTLHFNGLLRLEKSHNLLVNLHRSERAAVTESVRFADVVGRHTHHQRARRGKITKTDHQSQHDQKTVAALLFREGLDGEAHVWFPFLMSFIKKADDCIKSCPLLIVPRSRREFCGLIAQPIHHHVEIPIGKLPADMDGVTGIGKDMDRRYVACFMQVLFVKRDTLFHRDGCILLTEDRQHRTANFRQEVGGVNIHHRLHLRLDHLPRLRRTTFEHG